MVRLGLWKHFLFAFSCQQYGPKTGPDLYLAAARSLGSPPERTIVFEDALHAAQAARRAGFLVAGVYDPSAEGDPRRRCGRSATGICPPWTTGIFLPGWADLLLPAKAADPIFATGAPHGGALTTRLLGGTTCRRVIKLQCV